MALTKVERRIRIKRRIRKVIFGTAERPRLSVYRSNTQISAQLIDDNAGKTLVSASSLCKEIAEKKGNKTEQAQLLGAMLAEKAKAAGITAVVFDRNGYLYHGRVKALADAARNGGRTFSFSAIVVVGDENGTVGYGLGKANEVTTAIAKGVEAAKKNLIKVPVLKGTLPHEQEAKYSGATVFMRPASSGTGLVAGGAMRAVLESAGVKDVLAKSKGSSNPHNLVKATFAALKLLRDPRMIAQQRGISLDKVFNG